MAQLLRHQGPHFFRFQLPPLHRDHKRCHNLAVSFVRKAYHADFCDLGVAEEAVLDFERVDVFAAADDDVFDAAGDLQVAVGVHLGFVAGLLCIVSQATSYVREEGPVMLVNTDGITCHWRNEQMDKLLAASRISHTNVMN